MNRKKPKIGRYVLLIIIMLIGYTVLISGKINPAKNIYIKKGDSIQQFITDLSSTEKLRLKLYLLRNSVDTKKIQTGIYVFSGSYSPSEYVQTILKGPTQEYIRYTMLEGWSLFDIDASMALKGLISKGALLQRAQDSSQIADLAKKYTFLAQTPSLQSLEGFLYPDTYFLSTNGDIITQFFQAALKRFDEKIYTLRKQSEGAFKQNISSYGNLSLSFVGAVNLASVIEKEERAASAKPTIAGVFLNRLSRDIQLGADITLCYGLQEPYETCTPSVIVKGIYDENNPYNTRIKKGLPPTPISSITDTTFKAVLNPTNTSYLFYLHDTSGKIYYAETNAQHEENKRKYLQ